MRAHDSIPLPLKMWRSEAKRGASMLPYVGKTDRLFTSYSQIVENIFITRIEFHAQHSIVRLDFAMNRNE
jgi:hypothetical protein